MSEERHLLPVPVRCKGCKGVINYDTDGISVSGNVYDAARKSTIIGTPNWPLEESNGWTKIGKIPTRNVCMKCLLRVIFKRADVTFEETVVELCSEDNFRLMIQRISKKTWVLTDTIKHAIVMKVQHVKDRINTLDFKRGTK